MIDHKLRPLIDPPLNSLAKILAGKGLKANQVTVTGFLIGLTAMPLIAIQYYDLALLAVVLNRVADGLADIGCLGGYDSFTVTLAMLLEALGISDPGRAGADAASGRFDRAGDLPLNTHGGQLGFGQPDLAGGMTHVVEAVRQLRGEALGRQIPNATSALVTGNGATMSEAVALVLGAEA